MNADDSPSAQIDAKIASLGDWRAETFARLRALVREADPEVVEEVKWRKPSNPSGVLVWSHAGMICTGETDKGKVKLTFARGAALADPCGPFNASLDGGTRRAIDVGEGVQIDGAALKVLVRAAADFNTSRGDRSGGLMWRVLPRNYSCKHVKGAIPKRGVGLMPVRAVRWALSAKVLIYGLGQRSMEISRQHGLSRQHLA